MNLEKIQNIKFNEKYHIDEAYPDIHLTYLPQDILIMLKRVFVGKKSELTSIIQYTYQHLVMSTNTKLKSLYNELEEISKSEMLHYEILGKILVKCGIDPKSCVYIDGNPNLCEYWKASSVSYEKSLIKMFESNIYLEERAIADYIEIIKKTDNTNLKEILYRIIKDEKNHLMYFKEVLEAGYF